MREKCFRRVDNKFQQPFQYATFVRIQLKRKFRMHSNCSSCDYETIPTISIEGIATRYIRWKRHREIASHPQYGDDFHSLSRPSPCRKTNVPRKRCRSSKISTSFLCSFYRMGSLLMVLFQTNASFSSSRMRNSSRMFKTQPMTMTQNHDLSWADFSFLPKLTFSDDPITEPTLPFDLFIFDASQFEDNPIAASVILDTVQHFLNDNFNGTYDNFGGLSLNVDEVRSIEMTYYDEIPKMPIDPTLMKHDNGNRSRNLDPILTNDLSRRSLRSNGDTNIFSQSSLNNKKGDNIINPSQHEAKARRIQNEIMTGVLINFLGDISYTSQPGEIAEKVLEDLISKINTGILNTFLLNNIKSAVEDAGLSSLGKEIRLIWAQPTKIDPTSIPSSMPSKSNNPTVRLTTLLPSQYPTNKSSDGPSLSESTTPSIEPSINSSDRPSSLPALYATTKPSDNPSRSGSTGPSIQFSINPSNKPSVSPTLHSTIQPSDDPSIGISIDTSSNPTTITHNTLSSLPTSIRPSYVSTSQPSRLSSIQPSRQPKVDSNDILTTQPTITTSSDVPSSQPTHTPGGAIILPVDFETTIPQGTLNPSSEHNSLGHYYVFPTMTPSARNILFAELNDESLGSTTGNNSLSWAQISIWIVCCLLIALLLMFFVMKRRNRKLVLMRRLAGFPGAEDFSVGSSSFCTRKKYVRAGAGYRKENHDQGQYGMNNPNQINLNVITIGDLYLDDDCSSAQDTANDFPSSHNTISPSASPARVSSSRTPAFLVQQMGTLLGPTDDEESLEVRTLPSGLSYCDNESPMMMTNNPYFSDKSSDMISLDTAATVTSFLKPPNNDASGVERYMKHVQHLQHYKDGMIESSSSGSRPHNILHWPIGGVEDTSSYSTSRQISPSGQVLGIKKIQSMETGLTCISTEELAETNAEIEKGRFEKSMQLNIGPLKHGALQPYLLKDDIDAYHESCLPKDSPSAMIMKVVLEESKSKEVIRNNVRGLKPVTPFEKEGTPLSYEAAQRSPTITNSKFLLETTSSSHDDDNVLSPGNWNNLPLVYSKGSKGNMNESIDSAGFFSSSNQERKDRQVSEDKSSIPIPQDGSFPQFAWQEKKSTGFLANKSIGSSQGSSYMHSLDWSNAGVDVISHDSTSEGRTALGTRITGRNDAKDKEGCQAESVYTGTSSAASSKGSRQLIKDLMWLEKKIADRSASASKASESQQSPIMQTITCRDCHAPAGKLGIWIESTKDGPAIHLVKKESPLENQLFKGDLIIAINNVDTRSMNAEQVMNMMKDSAGCERKITVLHFED